MARGEEATSAADVYSLGCILYCTLVGHPPFEHDSEEAVLAAHQTEAVPAPTESAPSFPPGIDHVVDERWPSTGDRYASPADLASDLRAAAAGEEFSQAEDARKEHTLHALEPQPGRGGGHVVPSNPVAGPPQRDAEEPATVPEAPADEEPAVEAETPVLEADTPVEAEPAVEAETPPDDADAAEPEETGDGEPPKRSQKMVPEGIPWPQPAHAAKEVASGGARAHRAPGASWPW